MTIDYISKEKAQSLSYQIPRLMANLLSAPEECSYILISREKGFHTIFDVAIVLDKEIIFISDESLKEDVLNFLNN